MRGAANAYGLVTKCVCARTVSEQESMDLLQLLDIGDGVAYLGEFSNKDMKIYPVIRCQRRFA